MIWGMLGALTALILPLSAMIMVRARLNRKSKYSLVLTPIIFWPISIGTSISIMIASIVIYQDFSIDHACFRSECFNYSMTVLSPAWIIFAGTVAVTGIAIATIRHDEVLAARQLNERKQEVELYFKLRDEMVELFDNLDKHSPLKGGLDTDYGKVFKLIFPGFRYRPGRDISLWQDHLHSTHDAISSISNEEVKAGNDDDNFDDVGLSILPNIRRAQELLIKTSDLLCESTEYDNWGVNIRAKIAGESAEEFERSENIILFELGASLFNELIRSGVLLLGSIPAHTRDMSPRHPFPF